MMTMIQYKLLQNRLHALFFLISESYITVVKIKSIYMMEIQKKNVFLHQLSQLSS